MTETKPQMNPEQIMKVIQSMMPAGNAGPAPKFEDIIIERLEHLKKRALQIVVLAIIAASISVITFLFIMLVASGGGV